MFFLLVGAFIFLAPALPPFPLPTRTSPSLCRAFNLGRPQGGEIESARNTARKAQQQQQQVDVSPRQPGPAAALAPEDLRPELLTLLENNNVLPAEEPR